MTANVRVDLPLRWVGPVLPDTTYRTDEPWDLIVAILASRPGRWAMHTRSSAAIKKKASGRGLAVTERGPDLYMRWPEDTDPPVWAAILQDVPDSVAVTGVDLRFEDPPENYVARFPWALVAEALNRRPGEWALMTAGSVNTARATAGRHGLEFVVRDGSGYLRRPPEEDAVVREEESADDVLLVHVGPDLPDVTRRADPLPWQVIETALASDPGRWALLTGRRTVAAGTAARYHLDLVVRDGRTYLRRPAGQPLPPGSAPVDPDAAIATLPLEWKEPPALRPRRGRMDWERLGRVLAERPGEWFALHAPGNPNGHIATARARGIDTALRDDVPHLRVSDGDR